jgi:hypothetical protein
MSGTPPSTVTIHLDTAAKFWLFCKSAEKLGFTENDSAWFLARDCGEQIMEAIRNQTGNQGVEYAMELLHRSNQ